MKKITLFLTMLVAMVSTAMAQTFVEPVVGKYYKIQGQNTDKCWLTAGINSSGSIVVSADEAEAAVFLRTENGLKVVSTGKYMYYPGSGVITYSTIESNVALLNTGNHENPHGMYGILVDNYAYLFNNNTDGITHESGLWNAVSEKLWGFVEAEVEVIATMQELVNATTTGNATELTNYATEEGAAVVYEFNGSTDFLGGISNDAILTTLNGSKVVTVAAWVNADNTVERSVFGFGGQSDGVKFALKNGGVQITTKGKDDYNLSSSNVQTGEWQLLAWAFPCKDSKKQLRAYVGETDGQYWSATKGEMKTPGANDLLFAIGSGNQGSARDQFDGKIANLIVITSDDLLNNSDIASLIGEAPVRTHSLTISEEAGYATMFLDYAVAIPEGGVEAYYIAEDESLADYEVDFTQLTDYIPANTGVVLKNAGEYTFVETSEEVASVANMLEGSVETAYYEDANYTYYILAVVDNVTGFYADKFTEKKFTNNANKAFFKVAKTSDEPVKYSFRFPGEGTTGIENVESAVENNVYYDLSGRRVENPVKGIYIVNGKKVLVK